MNKRDQLLKNNAFSEVSRYEPERVKATRRKFGDEAAQRQLRAIALDRARELGVDIPR